MVNLETLIANAVEFVEGERGAVDMTTVVSQLYVLGKHSSGVWPAATQEQWSDAIFAASKRGLLTIEGDKVRLPTPARKPAREKESANQGTLF